MEFRVGKRYENRNGIYQVLRVGSSGMLIRYDNGTEQMIKNVELQKRIVQRVHEEKHDVYLDCICNIDDKQILSWILNQTLPEESLVNSCCWRRICQVRGRNFSKVDDETWEDICHRRGYLHARQNPRGF